MTNYRHVANVGKFHYTKNDGFYQFIKELDMTPYFRNRKNYNYWIFLRERYLDNININKRAQIKKNTMCTNFKKVLSYTRTHE